MELQFVYFILLGVYGIRTDIAQIYFILPSFKKILNSLLNPIFLILMLTFITLFVNRDGIRDDGSQPFQRRFTA